jgi:hypothetical protein
MGPAKSLRDSANIAAAATGRCTGKIRSRFPVRINFGQWLRWEAAIEEIRAYYAVPDAFRRQALTTFANAAQRIIASSPSLQLLPPQRRDENDSLDDDELAQPTIFPFAIRHHGRAFSFEDCRKIYRALSETGNADEIAAKVCLIGQPVALGHRAVLRISAGARLVSETWSSREVVARENLQRELGHLSAIVAKIEWLLGQIDGQPLA